MTETLLLGLVSSVVALLLAQTALEGLRSSMPADIAQHIEGWHNLRLDSRLVFVVPALAIGLGLLVGLIPAAEATRAELMDVLKDGERNAGGGRPQRIRQALVVGEIAVALALLVAAGLIFGGGLRLVNQPGGFDAQRLLTFEIPLPDSKVPRGCHEAGALRPSATTDSGDSIRPGCRAGERAARGWMEPDGAVRD